MHSPVAGPGESSVPMGVAASLRRHRGEPGGVVRRTAVWIQGWHGGQLLTFWAGAVMVPWQIGFWRELLFRNRLEGFLDPGHRPGPGGRIAELVVYLVLPMLALLVTAVWVRGRLRRAPPLG